MDPANKTDLPDFDSDAEEVIDEAASVEDFIRELEEKEKDLHITSDTTCIELSEDIDDAEIPDILLEEISAAEKVKVRAAAVSEDKIEIRRLKSEVVNLESKVTNLKSRIAKLEEERKELSHNAQRRLRDFEVLKARTEREREESLQQQVAELATQMLPVLDNLARALNCAPENGLEGFKQFFDGIVLVNQQVNAALSSLGVMPIESVGERFDPFYHEAVAMDESAHLPPNTVTEELLRGYRVRGKVIRHSMVKVSKPVESPRGNSPGGRPDGVDRRQNERRQVQPETNTAADDSAARNEAPSFEEFLLERNGEVEGQFESDSAE
jgi:molecular chaperone GrpE